MDAEEAALLAELRAISDRSAGGRRFDDGAGATGESATETAAPATTAPAAAPSPRRSGGATPEPELRSRFLRQQQEREGHRPAAPPTPRSPAPAEATIDGTDADGTRASSWRRSLTERLRSSPASARKAPAPAAATPETGGVAGAASTSSSTFVGERGGDAHDAELLALLRGVSNQSSSAGRFDDSGSGGGAAELPPEPPAPAPRLPAAPASSPKPVAAALPPWKRPRPPKPSAVEDSVVVVAAPPPSPPPAASAGGGFRSDQPSSTFVGERGGDAHDDELLALLRGVSSKSSSAGRFDDDGGGNGAPEPPPVGAAPPIAPGSRAAAPSPKPPPKERGTPPWRRERTAPPPAAPAPVVVVAAPPGSPRGGLRSDLPSTFTGDRGGDAHDAELLALLRGVSSKSSGTGRFDDGDGGADAPEPVDTAPVVAPSRSCDAVPSPKPRPKERGTPPWKRGRVPPVAEPAPAAPSPPSVAAPQGGLRSDLPSTFTGDRGGDAHDAELLALLRGVSSKSSSADRFANESGTDAVAAEVPASAPPSAAAGGIGRPPPSPVPAPRDHGNAAAPAPMGAGPAVMATADGDVEVLREDLPGALQDKNWKVRSAAFDCLGKTLCEIVGDRPQVWDVSADEILPGLDGMLPSLLADSNANALDRALTFVMLYAEHCSGAASAEQAKAIVSVLIKANGFSGRPGTTKLASAVVLKLMEVGSVASVNSVMDVLLTDGLASKKPKVVQAAASLVQEAALEFGTAVLPIAVISEALPRFLSHSNAKIRETGVKILAELCRALGSKEPLQTTIDEMKQSQVKELDTMLASQPHAAAPRTTLRMQPVGSAAGSQVDAASALQAGAEELAAQRFAARPRINLIAEVAKTDYASRLTLSKWSEKVAALNIVLECAGEKPYKLTEQSPSCNYAGLINDAKKLLSHTHFAVVSKSMEVLAMLAMGVGEKLFSFLRPQLLPVLSLSKDKKLTKTVGACLDSLFGNILSLDHLLDQNDALPDAMDEQKQKNALVRVATLEFLCRCVQRADKAGPRGAISLPMAKRCSSVCITKLEDSNADVRKASSETLQALRDCQDEDISNMMVDTIEGIKTKNPRAYKALSRSSESTSVGAPKRRSTVPLESKGLSDKASQGPSLSSTVTKSAKPQIQSHSTNITGKMTAPIKPNASGESEIGRPAKIEKDEAPISMSTALSIIGKLQIPLWLAPEDDGGILKGLESAKGIMRQDSIRALTSFVESGKLISSSDVNKECTAILIIVREHTRGLNETNVNIMRGIIQLFLAICDIHEKLGIILDEWSTKTGTGVAIAKISDKKASDGCKSLLTALCTVSSPHSVLLSGFEALQSTKSPIAHEEYLKWIVTFCADFGAQSLGRHVGSLIPYLLQESASANPKVKRESFSAVGTLHSHLGGQFRALILSMAKSPLREQVDNCIEASPFNESYRSAEWPKVSLASLNSGADTNGGTSLVLDIPKMDIASELSDDIIAKLGSKEGKTAWKHRKEALEELEAVLKRCSGLLDTSGSKLKLLIDLGRALEQRLNDTQINLKPLAAHVISTFLSVIDTAAQTKIGKIVFAQLINSAMNDIKKPMRDSCIKALQSGLTKPSIEGEGINVDALEVFVMSLIGQVNEVSTRASGLTDVLMLLYGLMESLPNLDEITGARGEPLGERYASMVVECLTSSKSETRSAATMIVEASLERGIVSMGSFRKATEKLKPVQQRTVGPLIAKYTQRAAPLSESGKENDESLSRMPGKGQIKSESPRTTDRPAEKHAIDSSRRGKETVKAPRDESPTSRQPPHPLLNRTGAQAQVSASPHFVWPEFPEEPHGVSLLTTLKKAWSPILPAVSVSKLFPESGLNKQDDSFGGLGILKMSVEIDVSRNENITEGQLDYIFKWTVFALCSRETTTGLVALLDFICSLLKFIIERGRPLNDSEVSVLFPYLVEKSGGAKGRFREVYAEIESLLQNEELLSPRQLGTLVCVPIIESSSQAKARAHASRLCMQCIEKEGLLCIGKKGALVAAKALSDETIPENRSVALDLMEQILLKMNGEIQKLVRMCGPSLSAHARQLIEERWHKRDRPSLPVNIRSVRIPDHVDEPEVSHVAPGAIAKEKHAGAGTSATFRARLQAIQNKGIEPELVPTSASPQANPDSTEFANPVDVEELYHDYINSLKSLTLLAPPLDEDDPGVQAATDGLRAFHAALSQQLRHFPEVSDTELARFRLIIAENLPECIGQMTHVIRFSFDCGDATINAGISIPLLSVCLATLMALFRDPDLAQKVTQEDLGLLIHATGTALLDHRLSAGSEVNETTSSQMVRAINKLAVQAATAAERHTSLLSLMALQQQISLTETNSSTDEEIVLGGRLSRVLSKLFVRVIKTEESTRGPFSRDDFDLEAVVCGLEDFLVASSTAAEIRAGALETCREMAERLLGALVDARGTDDLCNILEELELTECLRLVYAVAGDIRTQEASTEPPRASPTTYMNDSPEDCTNALGISSLVSALANAKTEDDRASALGALKQYEQAHGDGDLKAHLQQVSSPFRAFIERQMNQNNATNASRKVSEDATATGSMSERLLKLRSRLAATEAVVQTVTAVAPAPPTDPPPRRSPVPAGASRLSRPSPSRLPAPTPSRLGGSSAALRARLDAVKAAGADPEAPR